MVTKKEIPLLGLMFFTLIYAMKGNPDSEIWSGLYLIVNYSTLLLLFKSHKSKLIRQIGISLSASILLFILLKFFFGFKIDRIYTIVPFLICLIGIIKIELKK